MIVSQSDVQRCKTSDGAAVFIGEGLPTLPPNITEPQGAAGVAMAAVTLSGKRQSCGVRLRKGFSRGGELSMVRTTGLV